MGIGGDRWAPDSNGGHRTQWWALDPSGGHQSRVVDLRGELCAWCMPEAWCWLSKRSGGRWRRMLGVLAEW